MLTISPRTSPAFTNSPTSLFHEATPACVASIISTPEERRNEYRVARRRHKKQEVVKKDHPWTGIAEDIVPVNSFLYRSSFCNWFIVENSKGTVPFKRFVDSSIYFNLVMVSNCDGIEFDRLFAYKYRYVNPVSKDTWEDIVPVKPQLLKLNWVTTLPLQVIPVHVTFGDPQGTLLAPPLQFQPAMVQVPGQLVIPSFKKEIESEIEKEIK
jgi:hypothetical protein